MCIRDSSISSDLVLNRESTVTVNLVNTTEFVGNIEDVELNCYNNAEVNYTRWIKETRELMTDTNILIEVKHDDEIKEITKLIMKTNIVNNINK